VQLLRNLQDVEVRISAFHEHVVTFFAAETSSLASKVAMNLSNIIL